MEGEALLDTGSLAGDFVSERLVGEYSLIPIVTANHRTVCSGLNNECVKINTIRLLRVTFFNEIVNKNTSFDIEATILKNTPIDLIIGRYTIKKHKLFDQIPSQLGGKYLIPERITTSKCTKRKCDCKAPAISQVAIPTVFNPRSLLSSLIPEAQSILGTSLPDNDEIDHDKNDTFKPWLPTPSTTDVLSLIHISGDKDLQ